MRFLATFTLLTLTLACDKKTDSGTSSMASAASSGAVGSAGASGSRASASSATNALGATGSVAVKILGNAADGGESAVSGSAAAYVGEYTSVAGKLFVPEGDGFKGFKFRGDESGDGLGPGSFELTVSDQGRVDGEGAGALGAFKITGFVRDHMMTAVLSRKTKDGGFTGTLEATETAGVFSGAIHASLAGGNVLREATLSLKKK